MVTVISRIFLQSFFVFPNGFPNEGKAKIRIEESCRESTRDFRVWIHLSRPATGGCAEYRRVVAFDDFLKDGVSVVRVPLS
jgi:hypothetical protein